MPGADPAGGADGAAAPQAAVARADAAAEEPDHTAAAGPHRHALQGPPGKRGRTGSKSLSNNSDAAAAGTGCTAVQTRVEPSEEVKCSGDSEPGVENGQ